MKIKTVLLVILLLTAVIIHGQENRWTVEEVVEAGLAESSSVEEAEETVLDRMHDISADKFYNDIGLSLSGSVSGQVTDPINTGKLSGSVGLSVPVSPQVSLSSSLNSELRYGFNLSVKPFLRSTKKGDLENSYQRALIALDTTQLETEVSIRKAYIDTVLAVMARELLEQETQIKETIFEMKQSIFESGRSSLDSVNKAESDFLSTKRRLMQAELTEYRMRRELQAITGTDMTAAVLAPIEGAIPVLDGDNIDEIISDSIAVKLLEMELDALRRQLKATPGFDPSVSISGSVNGDIDDPAGGPMFSLGVTLNLSPRSFDTYERSALQEDIEDKIENIEEKKYSLETSLKTALINYEIKQFYIEEMERNLENQKANLEQTKYLYEIGEKLQLDILSAELAVKNAEQALRSARYDILRAYYDFLVLSR